MYRLLEGITVGEMTSSARGDVCKVLRQASAQQISLLYERLWQKTSVAARSTTEDTKRTGPHNISQRHSKHSKSDVIICEATVFIIITLRPRV